MSPERKADLAGNFGQGTAHHGLLPLLIGAAVSLAGIGLAYLLHLKERARADQLARGLGWLTRPMEAKYWVDEVYQATIVEPLRMLGRAFFGFDRFIVDGVVNAISWVPQLSGYALKLTVQRGYLQGYAAAMLFGVAAILLVIFL
jgi:NADH-quinone oxidoreductase subunit L